MQANPYVVGRCHFLKITYPPSHLSDGMTHDAAARSCLMFAVQNDRLCFHTREFIPRWKCGLLSHRTVFFFHSNRLNFSICMIVRRFVRCFCCVLCTL